MSQPSAGETLAAYSAESEINVRLIAAGHDGGLRREYLGSDGFGGAYLCSLLSASMAAFTILMKFEPSVADGFQLLTITLVKSRTPRGFVWEDVKKSFRRSSMRPRATFR